MPTSLKTPFKHAIMIPTLYLSLLTPILADTLESDNANTIELPTVTVIGTSENRTSQFADSDRSKSNAKSVSTDIDNSQINLINSSYSGNISGFSNIPLNTVPVSIQVIDSQQVQSIGAKRLSDLNTLDAAITDAYNVTGYYDYSTIRGFVLDNKFNYRRDGLPINAETAIALNNKAYIELLKGTSGIQSGTSSPGGLINYIVKRPSNENSQHINLEIGSSGNKGIAVDLNRRFGYGSHHKAWGLRINAAADHLNTPTDNTKGKSNLLAVALDWRINPDSVLSYEIESSLHSQMSVPALSLFGMHIPDANPIKNINNQTWSLPVVLNGTTQSVKFEQAISKTDQGNWRWNAQWMTQRLQSDDRAAFPYGCTDSSGDYYFNTYCPNGNYDLYDFSSVNEHRHTMAAQLGISGTFKIGNINHSINANVLRSNYTERGNKGAYNFVGTTNFDTPVLLIADPSLTYAYTDRDTKTTELSLSDTIVWNPRWTSWFGLRHTHLNTHTLRKSSSIDNTENFTTPWTAISYAILPNLIGYASYGQGTESNIVPNKSDYGVARGQYLATVRSKQTEIGFKLTDKAITWRAAAFNIRRPFVLDTGSLYILDGQQTHQGFEFSTQTIAGNWDLGSSFAHIQAKISGVTTNPILNGQSPVNVPKSALRVNMGYRFPNINGLSAQATVSYEGARSALINPNLVSIPAWRRVDGGLSYKTKVFNQSAIWGLDIQNLLNKRFFKESPTLYGHVYLVPQAARTVRLNLNMEF